jgi:drug/metabolite transporter (DMT)-like permease
VKYEKKVELDPMEYMFYIHGLGSLILTIMLPGMFAWISIWEMLKIVIFNMSVGVVTLYMFIYSLGRLEVGHISAIIFVGVLSAYFYGYILYGISVKWNHILGLCVMVYGMYRLLMESEKRK